ncbi:ABC-type dipeptide transport system periplasmic component-like protein [Parafrankia sp. EAN1pec]|nr:ABC-type dipeptide transport system periplasmic component-like protein [Frankia sp. EAN1pec]
MAGCIWGGLPVRFSNLRILVAESGGSWLPHFIQRLDFNVGHSPLTSAGWPDPDLSPLDLVQRTFTFSTQELDVARDLEKELGITAWMMEDDYPHIESVWPDTAAQFTRATAGFDPDFTERLAWRTGSELFRFPMPTPQTETEAADPRNAYAVSAVLGNALYGTLLNDDNSGAVQYSMAESLDIPDNGTTFELKLRSGLVSSDGTPLNSEAVKFNWNRIKDPATGASTRAEAGLVSATDVVDDLTLKITLSKPVLRFAGAITASPMNWIASPAALRLGQTEFDKKPVGAPRRRSPRCRALSSARHHR